MPRTAGGALLLLLFWFSRTLDDLGASPWKVLGKSLAGPSVIVTTQLLPRVNPQVRAHMPTAANEPQLWGTDSASTCKRPHRRIRGGGSWRRVDIPARRDPGRLERGSPPSTTSPPTRFKGSLSQWTRSPPRMANDMPTMGAEAWEVGSSRHQEVGPRISLQSLESPWQVRFPPSLVDDPKRHMRRSEAICPSLPTTLIHAGAVRDVLRHLASSGAERRIPYCRNVFTNADPHPGVRVRTVVSASAWPRRATLAPYELAPAIARSIALGNRLSKSRMPTHSGVMKTRAIWGQMGRRLASHA